jgi:hypothetical protein
VSEVEVVRRLVGEGLELELLLELLLLLLFRLGIVLDVDVWPVLVRAIWKGATVAPSQREFDEDRNSL